MVLYLREVVQSDYMEINRIFNRSLKEEEALEQKWLKKRLIAKEAPFQSFVERKGGTMQYSLAMLYMLRQNHIKAYLGIYKVENFYREEVQEFYAFVIYRESFVKWYVADFEPLDPDSNIKNPARISILKYKKLKGKLWIYDPYDKTYGKLPILGGFLEKPKFVI